jgi:hypothetical protein
VLSTSVSKEYIHADSSDVFDLKSVASASSILGQAACLENKIYKQSKRNKLPSTKGNPFPEG